MLPPTPVCIRCGVQPARLPMIVCDACYTATCARLLTTPQVALALGVTRARAWQLAQACGAGHRVGRDWLYTPADVAAMRAHQSAHPPGWPKGRPRRGVNPPQ